MSDGGDVMVAEPTDISKLPCDTLAVSSGKTKRKARSTRRRLNAMLSNASLHFSDTDSEGELTKTRTLNLNGKISPQNINKPTISVTLEPGYNTDGGGSSYGGTRRSSFVDNLTDVDEIYSSEPENNDKSPARKKSHCLFVDNSDKQGETDLEDFSNDEDEPIHAPIFIKPRADILLEFRGEKITTKEGDGPFSVEVRKRMSYDEEDKALIEYAVPITPDIIVMPTTDTEDVEASDDDIDEGAVAFPEHQLPIVVESLDQSQGATTNQMDQLTMPVREPEDAFSEGLTDIEDLE